MQRWYAAYRKNHRFDQIQFDTTLPNHTSDAETAAQTPQRDVQLDTSSNVTSFFSNVQSPLQPRWTQPKDAVRHPRGSGCQRSPRAHLRRPGPGVPRCEGATCVQRRAESVVLRFVQADMMRRTQHAEILTAPSRRSVRWIPGAPQRKPQCSIEHVRSSLRRSARSDGAVEQAHPVGGHAGALGSAAAGCGALEFTLRKSLYKPAPKSLAGDKLPTPEITTPIFTQKMYLARQPDAQAARASSDASSI